MSSHSKDSGSGDKMQSLEREFRKAVRLEDRKHRFTTYERCFVGSEAVDWLVASRHARNRDDAVRVGNAMYDAAVFEHVTRDHEFADSGLFYRFVDERERGSVTKGVTGDAVRWSDFLDPLSVAPRGPDLTPGLPLPSFETVPPASVHVASAVWPLDEHNARLLDNVHPPSWEDPPLPKGMEDGDGVTYNLVVIGAGAGGLVTAAGAAGVGAKVALVEANLLGGDCLNVGCVPSKALIHAANLAHTVKGDMEALAESGITIEGGADAVKVDFAKTMARLRKIRADISHVDSAERFTKKLGVDVYFGHGTFLSDHAVTVNGRVLNFRKCVIATGGYPALLPVPGVRELFEASQNVKPDEPRPAVMTNETIFNLTALPKRMVVIGTGVIGMELAQSMQRLGSQVIVLGRSGAILPKEDKDLALLVQKQMEKDGTEFRLGVKEYVSVSKTGIVLQNGLPELLLMIKEETSDGLKEVALNCDALLVATGRKPNVTGMDLEKAGVEYDSKLGLKVNDNLQTTNSKIFGVGDCCSAFKFTHAADFMARMVIRNALFLGRGKMSSLLIPYATFTTPEIAHVGLYESDLKEKGIAYQTFEKHFDDNDRAICDSETTGLVRIHVDAKSDTILGASICGAGAGNMISELTLAMQSGTGLGKLAAVIHPYPTTAEAIRQAGDLYNRGRLTTTVRGLLRGLIKVQ